MKLNVPREMTLQKFAAWIEEYTRCETRPAVRRLNVVVFADNIDTGCCVPLYAEQKGGQVMISELAGDFFSLREAWQALESGSCPSYPPVPFHQWVPDQYLTARKVKVEKVNLGPGPKFFF